MSETATPEKNGTSTGRVLRWLLGAQIVLALGLIIIDIGPSIPRLLNPSSQPELDQPTRPGDQTRRYRPRDPANPGPGVSPDMPRRLVAERAEIDGAPGLRLRGAITPGDGARIVEELRAASAQIVTLDSPGGSVSDALEIGRVLREMEVQTRLEAAAVCLSACPYVFVGGSARAVAGDARLGVHQHSFGTSTVLPAFLAVEDIQRGQAEVLAHFDAMGVDLRIMGPALGTPADEIYILTAEELTEWNVVTE
ncbi:hypothetical protein [uncultured Roseobacter sp.]|uniref:COG3904 family protein n=1 Tax=uncultured Roseobacter sp. TaxID=114847 RepID=UPI0026265D57|nr:hypothetical protein [uncultured Roseobacter sp.]